MKIYYTIQFRQADGQEFLSRVFSTIRAARKWKQYLTGCPYIAKDSIRIVKGGPGGIETK